MIYLQSADTEESDVVVGLPHPHNTDIIRWLLVLFFMYVLGISGFEQIC